MPVSHYTTLALNFKSLLGLMSLPTITAYQRQIGSGLALAGHHWRGVGEKIKDTRQEVHWCVPSTSQISREQQPMRARGTQWRETWGRCHPCRSCIHYKHSILVDKVILLCSSVWTWCWKSHAPWSSMEENSVELWQENLCLFDVSGIPHGQKSCHMRSVRWRPVSSVNHRTTVKLLTQDNEVCFENGNNLKTLKVV